jgi:glycosyltransferase involved in cell wall biosynthesis
LTALRSQLGLPLGAPIVICISRLHPQKGHDDLLTAWEQLTAVCSATYHLLIVGDGERRTAIAEAMSVRQINIHFLGQRGDVPDLLALSSLLVLPSLWEGLPNVVLEAMAAGLPVAIRQISNLLLTNDPVFCYSSFLR